MWSKVKLNFSSCTSTIYPTISNLVEVFNEESFDSWRKSKVSTTTSTSRLHSRLFRLSTFFQFQTCNFSNLNSCTHLSRASSGTSKDAKSILDDSLETCWSGEAKDDSKATLTFTFQQDDNDPSTSLVQIDSLKRLDLTFQGGYSVQKVTLLVRLDEGKDWERVGDVFPRDGNERQEFEWVSLLISSGRLLSDARRND